MVHVFGHVTLNLKSVQHHFLRIRRLFVTLFELKKLKTHSTPCKCFAFDFFALTLLEIKLHSSSYSFPFMYCSLHSPMAPVP